jgi:hypothetical protein
MQRQRRRAATSVVAVCVCVCMMMCVRMGVVMAQVAMMLTMRRGAYTRRGSRQRSRAR